jgi:hypothetical protein
MRLIPQEEAEEDPGWKDFASYLHEVLGTWNFHVVKVGTKFRQQVVVAQLV